MTMFAILRSRSAASSNNASMTTPPSPTSLASPRMQLSASTSSQQSQPPPSPARSHARSGSSSSSSSTYKRKHMSIGNIAYAFMNMRKMRTRANSRMIIETSGEPQTHEVVLQAMRDSQQSPFNFSSTRLTHTDHYICEGGVNLPLLLRATRGTLFEEAEDQGVKALSEEQWDVTIVPKRDTFKVSIRYMASTANSAVDPHRPVALDQAKGIPGLMTIVSRG